METIKLLPKEKVEELLSHATGTEHYYPLNHKYKCTDGVQVMMDNTSFKRHFMPWILTVMTNDSAFKGNMKRHGFASIKLVMTQKNTFKITIYGVNQEGQDIMLVKNFFNKIKDFVLEDLTIFIEDTVLLLPSEH